MKLLIGLTAGVAAVTAAAIALTPALAQNTPDNAPPAFAACRACHTVQAGAKSGLGPNLNHVVGRPAASVPGFNYSAALRASKLRWDEATLNEFLANPAKKVPGSRMPISTPDPVKRAAIIAYLKANS